MKPHTIRYIQYNAMNFSKERKEKKRERLISEQKSEWSATTLTCDFIKLCRENSADYTLHTHKKIFQKKKKKRNTNREREISVISYLVVSHFSNS